MKSHNRSNALLVELLIVILFFMLSATILLKVFATSRIQSDKAGLTGEALSYAQNVAERIYAADDAEDALTKMAFESNGDTWTLDTGKFTVRVTASVENTQAGEMLNWTVQALLGDEVLFSLPVSRYVEGQP